MTFDVCEEECVCTTVGVKVVVSMGEATRDVSEDVLMSSCVAEVALCDIRRV